MKKLKIISTKLFLSFLVLNMYLILNNTTLAVVTDNFAPKYGVTNTNTNFRSSASLSSSNIISTLPQWTPIKVVAQINDFYVIQTNDNKVGVIYKDYVTFNNTPPESAKTYYSLTPYHATAKGNSINIRSGPTTTSAVVGKLWDGQKVQVIGKIDDFFLIVTDSNQVGMVRQDLLSGNSSDNIQTPSVPNEEPEIPDNNITIPPEPAILTANQRLVLDLINNARVEKGLSKLEPYKVLMDLANIKAYDMVNNNYFGHTSPSLGTPFEFLKNNAIAYTAAGENIAGNPSLTSAVENWINSPEHSKNIFTPSFNYVGIGIAPSDKYGYILVALFIARN